MKYQSIVIISYLSNLSHLSFTNGAIDIPQQVRKKVVNYYNNGRHKDLIEYLQQVEYVYGTLCIDKSPLTSLYSFRGVALASHVYRDQHKAIEAFKNSTLCNPSDTRSWINLGEVNTQVFQFPQAIAAYERAEQLGDIQTSQRLVKVKAWTTDYKLFEYYTSHLEAMAMNCYKYYYNISYHCLIDSTTGFEWTDIPGEVERIFHQKSPNSIASTHTVPKYQYHNTDKELISYTILNHTYIHDLLHTISTTYHHKNIDIHPIPSIDNINNDNNNNNFIQHSSNHPPHHHRRLRVGFISSDFGVHPVSTLIRGFFQFIDISHIEIYVYTLNPNLSYWGINISKTVEHFTIIQNMNTYDSAVLIAKDQIDILIDLNGHTLHSGLQLMSHQPAYIQMSFLGLPTTTGAPFIDYYIGDWISIPSEQRADFTEHLLLLPPCYIINDYAQMQGDIIYLTQDYRSTRATLIPDINLDDATVLFGTISNTQKFDLFTFISWMNILHRVPGSKMMILYYEGTNMVIQYLRLYGQYFGISMNRLALTGMIPWLDHMYTKTAIDIILDTTIKNGHTTGLDGVWAGIPNIALGGGRDMPTRAGESIALGLGSELGLGYTLKEYENLAVSYTRPRYSTPLSSSQHTKNKNILHDILDITSTNDDKLGTNDTQFNHRPVTTPWQLRILREYVEKLRLESTLFNTRLWSNNFIRMMEATWELHHYSAYLYKTYNMTQQSYPVYKGHHEQVPVYTTTTTTTTTTDMNSDTYKDEKVTSKSSNHHHHKLKFHIFAMNNEDILFQERNQDIHSNNCDNKQENSTMTSINTDCLHTEEFTYISDDHNSSYATTCLSNSMNQYVQVPISQALDGHSVPTWLATTTMKQRFINKYGYDPEYSYRVNGMKDGIDHKDVQDLKRNKDDSKRAALDKKLNIQQTILKDDTIEKTINKLATTTTTVQPQSESGQNTANMKSSVSSPSMLNEEEDELSITVEYVPTIRKTTSTTTTSTTTTNANDTSPPVTTTSTTPSTASTTTTTTTATTLSIISNNPSPFPSSSRIQNHTFHQEILCQPFINLPLNLSILKAKYIHLHIGGLHRVEGWYNVDIQHSHKAWKIPTHVDIIRQMHDLEGFPDQSVTAIYASHVFEHTSVGDDSHMLTLKEWHRVLNPGGLLFIAVPNMDVLARLFINETLSMSEKVYVLRMMFGGQSDAYDYHRFGYNLEILTSILREAKFCKLKQVDHFNIFPYNDSSDKLYKGHLISLNIIARPCEYDSNNKILIERKGTIRALHPAMMDD